MKTKKKVVLWMAVPVVAILLFISVFLIKFKFELSKMTPVETGKVTDNVYVLKDSFVNMYLIQSGNDYIAIDAGMKEKVITRELRKLNIDPDKVIAVLLTHTDMDHVGALGLFKKARVYISKPEELMLTGKEQKIPLISNSISREDYVLLNDRQELKIGNEKSIGILTVGHTSGSMCYLINDKYLFTGDILSLKNGKIGPSVKFLDLDHKKATQSIAKITHIPQAQYIFTSHFGYSADYSDAVRDWK